MSKSCGNCKHFNLKEGEGIRGRCNAPLPESVTKDSEFLDLLMQAPDGRFCSGFVEVKEGEARTSRFED